MLYSGVGGAGGLLAQVLLHAVVSSSLQSEKVRKDQVIANQVLAPPQAMLEDFIQDHLEHDSDYYKFIDDEESDANFIVNSDPVYYVSQNLRFISLRNAINVEAKGREDLVYENVIEVLAPQIVVKEPLELLGENNGAGLKSTAKQLYIESLRLALADFRGELKTIDADTKHQTHRIPQGDTYRVERGVALESDSSALVIRNLRGWIIAYHGQ